MKRLAIVALAALAGLNAAAAAERAALAISHDPPIDAAFPASSHALQVASHGDAMNAMVYVPAGKGPHPVVVLLHGFPGNEQNLDLAQAMRRAGWAVVTFHYRGSWGSAGTFSFDGAVEDGGVVFDWVREPAVAQKLRLDPQRIAVVGHSMGGFVAAQVCSSRSPVLGCGLIAPWDLSYDVRLVKGKTPAERDRIAREAFDDVDGRVAGLTARQVVDVLAEQGEHWQLARTAPAIAKHPLLIVLASRDAEDDKALDLLPALKAEHATALRVETLDSDHSFNDRRIALQNLVLTWLASLTGAPSVK
jgi:acetyl esterase/lipase